MQFNIVIPVKTGIYGFPLTDCGNDISVFICVYLRLEKGIPVIKVANQVFPEEV